MNSYLQTKAKKELEKEKDLLMSEELDKIFEEEQRKLREEFDLPEEVIEKEIEFSENYKKLLKAKITFDTETPPLIPIIEILSEGERVHFGTLGNFSVIQGKPKTGKSFILLPIIGARLFPGSMFLDTFGSKEKENIKVLFFDTEQGRARTKRILERLFNLAIRDTRKGEEEIKETIENNFDIFSLREFNSKERFEMIEEAIKHTQSKLIIIDGIIDLTEANDKEEAKKITEFLMKATEIYQCHIITIIHENKEGINSRGDVGSLLDMKAEAVYRVEKQGNRHEVISHRSRDKAPSRINFTIDEKELPTLIKIENNLVSRGRPPKMNVTELTRENKVELLKMIYSNSKQKAQFEYQNLIYYLKQAYIEKGFDKLGDNQVKELIANLKGEGYLSQSKAREPYFISDELMIIFKKDSRPDLPY